MNLRTILSLLLFSSPFIAIAELTLEERIECGVNSAIKYNIPADILLAISTIENGKIGVGYKNKDGSIDYGIMQINSIYLKELKERYNLIVTPEEVISASCFAFEIAAFKISEHLKNDKGSFLERVAMYHSRTEDLNRVYQTKLILHSAEWRKIFTSKEYITYLWHDNR